MSFGFRRRVEAAPRADSSSATAPLPAGRRPDQGMVRAHSDRARDVAARSRWTLCDGTGRHGRTTDGTRAVSTRRASSTREDIPIVGGRGMEAYPGRIRNHREPAGWRTRVSCGRPGDGDPGAVVTECLARAAGSGSDETSESHARDRGRGGRKRGIVRRAGRRSAAVSMRGDGRDESGSGAVADQAHRSARMGIVPAGMAGTPGPPPHQAPRHGPEGRGSGEGRGREGVPRSPRSGMAARIKEGSSARSIYEVPGCTQPALAHGVAAAIHARSGRMARAGSRVHRLEIRRSGVLGTVRSSPSCSCRSARG